MIAQHTYNLNDPFLMPITAPVEFKRELTSKLDQIAVLAGEFEAWSEHAGVPMNILMRVNLMLDELITNVVLHGYQGAEGQWVQVRATMDDGRLMIELSDKAPPFNPLEHASADIEAPMEEREIGGLGIHFVRQLADSIEYRRENNQNILKIVKNVNAA